MTTTLMIDTIGANAGNIPAATPKIAGYVTGQGSAVAWTPADWARFPHAGHVRIDQDPAASDPLGSDVLDVESGAATVADVAAWVHTRASHGIQWSTIYGTDATLAAVWTALVASQNQYGHHWFFGHVDVWLADWNLNEAGAAAVVGTMVHGMTCHAVQWASPTSNPNTIVPGSTLTLAQANVDLNATQPAWHAYVPPKPPPPQHTYYGLLVINSTTQLASPISKRVTSTDGRTWQ